MTWNPQPLEAVETAANPASVWAPTVMPGFSVDRSQLRTAADAVAQAIARLQFAQETDWKSVAADSMREELFETILLLRAIAAAIDEALNDIGSLNFAGMCVAT